MSQCAQMMLDSCFVFWFFGEMWWDGMGSWLVVLITSMGLDGWLVGWLVGWLMGQSINQIINQPQRYHARHPPIYQSTHHKSPIHNTTQKRTSSAACAATRRRAREASWAMGWEGSRGPSRS
jgi:hypothetical protein